MKIREKCSINSSRYLLYNLPTPMNPKEFKLEARCSRTIKNRIDHFQHIQSWAVFLSWAKLVQWRRPRRFSCQPARYLFFSFFSNGRKMRNESFLVSKICSFFSLTSTASLFTSRLKEKPHSRLFNS